MEIDRIFEDYNLFGIEDKLETLFPENQINLEELFGRILTGDIIGGLSDTLNSAIQAVIAHFSSLKDIFIWIMILGILAALISHFIEVFDNHQIADIGFYFTYLLMVAILMKCFLQSSLTAAGTIDKIVSFVRIFIPAYFMSVGVATGTVTATTGYQLILLIIYLVEKILFTVILPLINSYVLLSILNGIWTEEKLSLLVEGMEKIIRFLLKASLGVVTGISVLQSMITPAIDSVKASALQKTISAIPGIGDVTDGVVEMVLGSAVVVKNSIGLVMLLLLLAVAAAPLLEILITAFLMKAAAAFLGIVSDKRVTSCTDKVGNASQLLLRTTGTSLLLFLITISVAAYTTNRGF